MLTKGLESQGFNELMRELRDFVINNRDALITLEEAYTEDRYGEISYDIDDVSKALNVAKELIRLLDKVLVMSSWVRYHFEHLRRWREYAVAVMRAAKDLVPGVRVFVIGGVAEGRTTVLSDIDILIIIPGEVTVNKGKLYKDILIRAMDVYGLPWDAPVELHIVGDDESRYYFELSSRVIEIEDDLKQGNHALNNGVHNLRMRPQSL